jgi:hypothetical protein
LRSSRFDADRGEIEIDTVDASVTVARVGITVTVFPEPEEAAAPVFAVPEADPDGPDAVVAVAAASEAAENAVIPVDLSADAEPAPDVTGSPEPADGV